MIAVRYTYTGVRLTQNHLDVFEAIMQLAREKPEDYVISFSSYGLLKRLGRGKSQNDHARLRRAMLELKATAILIEYDGDRSYCGSLLPEWSKEDGKFSMRVNRDLIKFFNSGFTLVQWEQRKKLSKKPLAQALHIWLCSHEHPFPVTVQYLHAITGSQTKAMKAFRQNLKAALGELKKQGVLLDWHIDESDKVHFQKA